MVRMRALMKSVSAFCIYSLFFWGAGACSCTDDSKLLDSRDISLGSSKTALQFRAQNLIALSMPSDSHQNQYHGDCVIPYPLLRPRRSQQPSLQDCPCIHSPYQLADRDTLLLWRAPSPVVWTAPPTARRREKHRAQHCDN